MIFVSGYSLGVTFSVASGISNNVGMVLQKRVVSELPDQEKRFMRRLIKNPVWLVGLILQLALGTALFIFAQAYIGPALIPGLMSVGLVFLAIGAVRIAHESLGKVEKAGIGLMIVAITLIGLSGLSVQIMVDYTQPTFLERIWVFTLAGLVGAVMCFSVPKRYRQRAVLFAIGSGFLTALTNFWIAPLIGVIEKVFTGIAVPTELAMFAAACVILILTGLFSITTLQTAFKTGEASRLVPLQAVPIQIAPALVYFYVFVGMGPSPSDLSMAFMFGGILLIIIAGFLLGKQQGKMEKIK
jgi:drug/metabolite transporter (DMT)-like permease